MTKPTPRWHDPTRSLLAPATGCSRNACADTDHTSTVGIEARLPALR